MSVFVVDASVGLKWLLPEPFQVEAQRLQHPNFQLHVPTLFDVEIANVLWKMVRRGDLARADADEILTRLPVFPLTRHPEAPLLAVALDVAVQAGRTVYDSLYLALAIQPGGRMVTADEKFRNALAATPWNVHVCWIEDVP